MPFNPLNIVFDDQALKLLCTLVPWSLHQHDLAGVDGETFRLWKFKRISEILNTVDRQRRSTLVKADFMTAENLALRPTEGLACRSVQKVRYGYDLPFRSAAVGDPPY